MQQNRFPAALTLLEKKLRGTLPAPTAGLLKQEAADLEALWNGDFYRKLRAGLASGRPHPWCTHCVKFRGYNVDSLLAHLTNRPDQQGRLLDEIALRGLADVAPYRAEVAAAGLAVPR